MSQLNLDFNEKLKQDESKIDVNQLFKDYANALSKLPKSYYLPKNGYTVIPSEVSKLLQNINNNEPMCCYKLTVTNG